MSIDAEKEVCACTQDACDLNCPCARKGMSGICKRPGCPWMAKRIKDRHLYWPNMGQGHKVKTCTYVEPDRASAEYRALDLVELQGATGTTFEEAT